MTTCSFKIKKNTEARKFKRKLTFRSQKVYILIALLMSVTFLFVGIILWAVTNHTEIPSTTEATVTSETPDYGYFIPREAWGGVAPKSPSTSIAPAMVAVVKHTGGATCLDNETCRARVRQIQKEHMDEQKLPDISYNFLIGGDDKIYVGRGWAVQNGGRNDSLDMAFIGNFTENFPTYTMLSLVRRILTIGPSKKGLDYLHYYVVNHNQTEPTDSPGVNLFRAVSEFQFQHYSAAVCYSNTSTGIVIDYQCPGNATRL